MSFNLFVIAIILALKMTTDDNDNGAVALLGFAWLCLALHCIGCIAMVAWQINPEISLVSHVPLHHK